MEPADDLMRRRLAEWRRRLVQGGQPEALPIEAPAVDAIFGRLFGERKGWRITTTASDRPAKGELRVAAAPEKIAALHQRAQAAHDQAHLHLAHLAIGAVPGRPDRLETDPFAPLLLVPVELRRADGHAFSLQAGPREPLLNPALAWVPQASNAELPPLLGDWAALRPSAWLDEVDAALSGTGVRVERRAYLALLPVGRWLMVQQLEADEAALLRHPVLRVLAGEPGAQGAFARGAVRGSEDDARARRAVWAMDTGQETALRVARQGGTLVGVSGPPGSGRSQILANLLASSIAEGKTVLLVGRTPGALEEVRQRLASAGLDRYCLTLRGGGGSELLSELRRALAELPEPSPRAVPETGDRLDEVRARLSQHVQELHDRRWPLERSVAEVLTELAGLHDAPALVWRYRHPELLTPEQLVEALQLTERLVPLLALAREPEAAPWERCLEPGTGQESAREWRRRLERLETTSRRLRDVATTLAAAHGLPAPASPAEIERILELDAWLLRDTPAPDHWLAELDIPAAREEAEWWQERMDAHRSEKARLMVSFAPALFELPESALEDLEQAARRVELMLGVNIGTLLGVRGSLDGWIAHTRSGLPEWRMLSTRLAEAVGLDDFPINLESALRLASLARMLGRPERPPAPWMDRRVCARVESVLREAAELQQRLNKVRRAVLSVYAASVMEIAAEPLIADFVGRYSGRWRFLWPGYHRTLRLLRRHRLDHRTPDNPLSELRKIRFFRHCTAALEALTERHRELLAEYASSLVGSLAPAHKALETAREILERTAGAVDLEALTRSLQGPTLTPEAASWLSQLEGALERNGWQMARCKAALPAGAVPGHGVGLRQVPFDALERWLTELAEALAGLDQRLAQVRALMVAGDGGAFGFEEALDALIRVAGLGSFERKLEAEAAHLRSVYGALFRGLDTDWPAVLDALDAVENARAVYGSELPTRGAASRGAAADPTACRDLFRELASLVEELDGRFEQAHSRRRYPLDASDSWEATSVCLATLSRWLEQRQDWIELAHLRQQFELAELGWLFQELRAREVGPPQAGAAVRRAGLQAWWHAQREDSSVLRAFDGTHLEADIAAFREADEHCRERARREVVEAAEARRPPTDALDGVGGDTAALGLRALTLQLRDTLRTLTPVVMACPFTAGLLPREMVFDRVVVHESEPIAVEEALAALARGRQAVVFGPARPAAGSTSLLAEVEAAGAPTVRLSSDYRGPGEQGARKWAEQAVLPAPNALREQVARAVRGFGYDVVERAGPDPGAAMLWVLRPGTDGPLLLGVDANDADPASARRTLAERYAILPSFAERLGCPLHRVHALQWIDDHPAALEALRRALPPAEAVPEAVPEPVAYEVASLDRFELSAAALREPGRRESVVAALRHLVAVEGPVHRERAAARVLAACGLPPGRRRQPDLEKALRAALDGGGIEERGGFLHAPGGSPVRVRTPRADEPESRRRLSELPPEEMVLAAEMLLGSSGRLRRPALFTEMARLFGLGRGTRRGELEKALRAAGAGRLALEGEWVSLRRQ